MKILNFIPSIFFVVLFSLTCSAQVADFETAARAIPQQLIRKGYSQFGDLNLQNFIQTMDQVQIFTAPEVETPEDNNTVRIFAHWQRNANGTTITLSERAWPAAAQTPWKNALALHEMLGALGYEDQNYNLSTSLWFLAQDKIDQILNKNEMHTVIRSTNDLAKSTGGIIGVGGGGDLIGPGAKISVLENYLEKFAKDPTEENRAAIFMGYQIIKILKVEAHWTDKK